MKIFYSSKLNKTYQDSTIAVGNFDGVHLGHKKVLREAYQKAKKNKKKFGLLTFEPIPLMFFSKKIKNHRINSFFQKKLFLKKEKLDFLIIQKFNLKFSNFNYKKFIKNIIYKNIKCKNIYVSKNFKFGKNREGNVKRLQESENKYNYKTVIIKPLKKNKKIVSSSIIRNLIKNGKISKIKSLLGRNWEIEGKVIKGDQRGRKLGFPTCNISLRNYVIPKFGVYAVNVKFNKMIRKGIANVGYRPTFNGKKLLLEVNIFGIKKNLYNNSMNVIFTKFIRPEKKFKSIENLKKQIIIDIQKAKKNV